MLLVGGFVLFTLGLGLFATGVDHVATDRTRAIFHIALGAVGLIVGIAQFQAGLLRLWGRRSLWDRRR